MRVALIIADDRDSFRDFDAPLPYFGSGATARVEGFASVGQPEIHIISCVRQPVNVPEKLADNVFYHPVYVTGGFRKTFFIQYLMRIRKKLAEIKPDIVHGFGTEDYQAFCAAFSGYPNCITIQGNLRAVAKKLRYRPFPHLLICAVLEWVALRKTDAVFCNSSYTDDQVGRLCGKKWILPVPVRQSFWEVVRHESVPPVLLCLGTVVSYKNQLGLICALAPLAEQRKFSLCFAGGAGADQDYFQDFLSAIKANDWCRYLGKLKVKELQEWLGRAHALVHPSFEDSFGIVIIEAMATGLPVAASNVGGIPDIIEDGVNGLIFDPKNPESIRDAVQKLFDTEVSVVLGEKGRESVRRHYLPAMIAEKHVQYYQQLLATEGSVWRKK
jgi:glycosyltransferase involved in cell wall biosynthesis